MEDRFYFLSMIPVGCLPLLTQLFLILVELHLIVPLVLGNNAILVVAKPERE
jgi:hypothetical protein